MTTDTTTTDTVTADGTPEKAKAGRILAIAFLALVLFAALGLVLVVNLTSKARAAFVAETRQVYVDKYDVTFDTWGDLPDRPNARPVTGIWKIDGRLTSCVSFLFGEDHEPVLVCGGEELPRR